MLVSHPESSLSLNTMKLGADILLVLEKKKEFVLTERVLEEFLSADIKRTPDNFLDTLCFLFSLNLVESNNLYKIKKVRTRESTLL